MKIGGNYSGDGGGEKPPVGVYPAVLIGCWDCFIQAGYQGKPPVQKFALGWETNKKDSKGKPFLLFESVSSSSFHKSTAAKRYMALAGRSLTTAEEDDGFDIEQYVGRAVLLNVVAPEEEGKWPKIAEAMPLPDGMPAYQRTVDFKDELPGFVKKARERALTPAQIRAAQTDTGATEAQPWGEGDPPF